MLLEKCQNAREWFICKFGAIFSSGTRLAILAKLKNEFSFIRGNILINTITLTIIIVTAATPLLSGVSIWFPFFFLEKHAKLFALLGGKRYFENTLFNQSFENSILEKFLRISEPADVLN